MKIEYCQKCDRPIKPEEKTHTKDGQILCEECYLRARKQEVKKAGPELTDGKYRDSLKLKAAAEIDEFVQKQINGEESPELSDIDLLKNISNTLNGERKRKDAKEREQAVAALIAFVIAALLVIWGYRSCSKIQDAWREAGDEIQRRTRESYRVENVRVKKTYPNAWGVCGLIRNLKHRSVKGYVDIEFLDSSGKSYFTTSTYVKDPNHAGLLLYIQADWIEPREVGAFEYWDDPKAFRGLSDFRISFRESQ